MQTIYTREVPNFKFLDNIPMYLILPDLWDRQDKKYIMDIFDNRQQSIIDGTLEIIHKDHFRTMICVNR